MNPHAVPTVVLVGFLFGSTLIASRFGIQQFDPITFSGLRLTLAALLYVFLYLFQIGGNKWPRDWQLWKHAAVLGVFDTAIPITFVILSLQVQSSGLTSILVTTGPAITVLLAHFFLPDEPITHRKALGVGLALGGAMLLGLRGESGLSSVRQSSLIGLFLVLAAHTCISLMTIYARKFMQEMDAVQVGSVRVIVAALLVMPIALALEGFDLSRVTGTGYTALAYAAVPGTFLTMYLVFYNVKRFGATAEAMAMYVIPIVGGLGGMLLLNEVITPTMVGGMAMIVLGLTIINHRSRQYARAT